MKCIFCDGEKNLMKSKVSKFVLNVLMKSVSYSNKAYGLNWIIGFYYAQN